MEVGVEDHVEGTGPVVPGYRLIRRRGRGAFGEVWVAADARGDTVAVKVLRTAAAEESGRRETALGAAFDIPGLVVPRETVRAESGALVLIEDYLPGGSLAEVVGVRGALAPGQAATVLVALADVLSRLHSRGVAHGDLSPANVLFTAEGEPRLADLGVARLAVEPGGEPWGDPRFAAPELTTGRPQGLPGSPGADGPAADVHALGMLAWFMLSGRAVDHPDQRVPLAVLVPGIDAGFAELLADMTATDPRHRPRAEDVALRVREVCEALPVDPVPDRPEGAADLVTRRLREAACRPPTGRGPRRAHGVRGRGARAIARRVTRKGLAVAGASVGALAVVAGVWLVGSAVVAEPVPEAASSPGPRPMVPSPRADPSPVRTGSASGPPRPGPSGWVADRHTDRAAALDLARQDDPLEALRGLLWLRELALAAPAADRVADVDAPDSQAARTDTELLSGLERAGHVLRGVAFTGRDVRLADRAGAQARLELDFVTGPYDQVDGTGRVVGRAPHETVERLSLELRRTDDGWRVAQTSGR